MVIKAVRLGNLGTSHQCRGIRLDRGIGLLQDVESILTGVPQNLNRHSSKSKSAFFFVVDLCCFRVQCYI